MSKIDFLGKKYVKITMEFVVEYDANEMDINDVVSSVVTCFYEEDKEGNEMFLPYTDSMKVQEYTDSTFIDVTEEFIK
jgi:hypothetical protein